MELPTLNLLLFLNVLHVFVFWLLLSKKPSASTSCLTKQSSGQCKMITPAEHHVRFISKVLHARIHQFKVIKGEIGEAIGVFLYLMMCSGWVVRETHL